MPYSFLDLAYDVLKGAEHPLTYREIWEAAQGAGIASKIGTAGKTPWQSLGSQLYVDVRDNKSSKFIKVGKHPACFFLQERRKEIPAALTTAPELLDEKSKKAPSYKERDLHPVLTYFAFAAPTFNRGRAVVTKTIYHEKSKKAGYSEWTYPDMVGFSMPLDDWMPEVISLNEMCDRNALTLFSFELKRQLTKSTYREAYFQAVSNSSWAHHGYVVAAEIAEDDDLRGELERLVSSFGIGIIQLELSDLSDSRVVYPARVKPSLDWETINKLCEESDDFQSFIQSVKIDVHARKVHREEFDAVNKDIEAYVRMLRQGDGESGVA
jgi:hypothetical protein